MSVYKRCDEQGTRTITKGDSFLVAVSASLFDGCSVPVVGEGDTLSTSLEPRVGLVLLRLRRLWAQTPSRQQQKETKAAKLHSLLRVDAELRCSLFTLMLVYVRVRR